METRVIVHDRVLPALDTLPQHEQTAVQSTVTLLRSGLDISDPRVHDTGKNIDGEIFFYTVTPDLSLAIRRSAERPGQVEVLDVFRPEVLKVYRTSHAA
jgi:hypothetical protein